MIESKE